MTTLETISAWVREPDKLALREGKATHVLVVCDDFDMSDYPVVVLEDEDIAERIEHYGTNMQRVMEVYNLGLDINAQLGEFRAWHP